MQKEEWKERVRRFGKWELEKLNDWVNYESIPRDGPNKEIPIKSKVNLRLCLWERCKKLKNIKRERYTTNRERKREREKERKWESEISKQRDKQQICRANRERNRERERKKESERAKEREKGHFWWCKDLNESLGDTSASGPRIFSILIAEITFLFSTEKRHKITFKFLATLAPIFGFLNKVVWCDILARAKVSEEHQLLQRRRRRLIFQLGSIEQKRDQPVLVTFEVVVTSVTRWRKKGIPNLSKNCPKRSNGSFSLKVMSFENPKKLSSILATFERKIVPKNFQKSPNLVTLVVTTFVLHSS